MNKLQIGIVGYGSMGKIIEQLANEKGVIVSGIFDINNHFSSESNTGFDVAIEFSVPDAVESNIRFLAERGINIVLGTTGWYDKMDLIREIVSSNGTGLVWGSNFSVGMQMFYKIIDKASMLVNQQTDYDIMVHEMHHHRKKDSPGGSAKQIADIILNNMDRKKKILAETSHAEIEQDMLHVSSTRGGEIAGLHSVYIDSAADTIELTHRAKNRTGFASGALLAASWINGKKGFWEFSEILDEL